MIFQKKEKKSELVEEIVIFENDLSNYDITERRKNFYGIRRN